MSRALACAVVLAVLLAACIDKPRTEDTPAASESSTAQAAARRSPPPPSAASPSEPEEDLPSEETAVQKAAHDITKANYKTELAKIEKELSPP